MTPPLQEISVRVLTHVVGLEHLRGDLVHRVDAAVEGVVNHHRLRPARVEPRQLERQVHRLRPVGREWGEVKGMADKM